MQEPQTKKKISRVLLLLAVAVMIFEIVILLLVFMLVSRKPKVGLNLSKTEIEKTCQDKKGTSGLGDSHFDIVYSKEAVEDMSKYSSAGYNTVEEIEQDLKNASYTVIPDTDLIVKLPTNLTAKVYPAKGYDGQIDWGRHLSGEFEMGDLYNEILNCKEREEDPLHEVYRKGPYYSVSYCNELKNVYKNEWYDGDPDSFTKNRKNNININLIYTDMPASEWVLDNIRYQGKSIREWGSEDKGDSFKINGFNVHSVQAACCAGYDQNYFIEYKDIKGRKVLVGFANSEMDWKLDGNRNVLLDKVVGTIRKID